MELEGYGCDGERWELVGKYGLQSLYDCETLEQSGKILDLQ